VASGTVRYPRIEPRDDDSAEELIQRTLTKLYNKRPAWLVNAHAKVDAAVAAAYSFNVDLTNEQILERLLALNRDRAEGEKLKKQTIRAPRTSRDRNEAEFV